MDEQRFKALVEFTSRNFVTHQPESNETPGETRARHYRNLPESARGDFLRGLLAESDRDKWAWDAVKLIAEDVEQLPRRPRKGGTDANRDWVFCMAVHHVGVRFHLLPTRNHGDPSKCCAEGDSACDVVGRALKVGSYVNAERIWLTHDRILSYARNNFA